MSKEKPADAEADAAEVQRRRNKEVRGAAAKIPGLPRRGLASIDAEFEWHVPGIQYGVLDELVSYAVRRAQIVIYADFFPALAPWEISPQRSSALFVIAHNPGLRMSQLAHIIGVAPSGAAIVAQALEALGYIERKTAADDGRASTLYVSEKGQKVLDEIAAALREYDRRISSRLTEDERQTLMHLLGQLGA